MATGVLENRAKKWMLAGRRRTAQEEDRFLTHQEPNPTWGKGRALDKKLIIQAIWGDANIHISEEMSDVRAMGRFLRSLDPTCIPEGAPLPDYLVYLSKVKDDGWAFPRLGYLENLQQHRGLSLSMLDKCEIKEIIIGQTSGVEIESIIYWMLDHLEKNEISLPCSGLAFDIITQKVSLRDLYRMAGKILTP